jgi:hypothetical protein
MIKQLSYPGFIDPRFMRALPVHGEVKDGKVVAGDTILLFVDMPYREGIAVKVFLHDGGFACQSLAEIETENRQAKLRDQALREVRRIQEQQRIEAAKAFNRSLNIPVKWRSEYKPVLSGLTESSMGNGQYANTVYHVLLEDPIHEGRLHRGAGQPLCSAGMGSFGELVAWREDRYHNRVTCKQCLKIAGRWQGEANK